ncbi:hypothetical protein [Leekyejoonella antrihumi]|uniref:Uncharacterized protein n=1 Tax=Leekyejoonella antrihumi TaxID=1660198 RepID=A0A563DWB7_9MICO|nr:hypothetical protein [Leekyejoonella antrihumi]TWP34409.1 hypothetical protein FGL98_17720 [Leekyejoonella antrihumi]
MNNEPNKPSPEQREPQLGDAYVLDVIQDPPSPDAAHLIEEVYARHGNAFAVYLSLEDVDQYSESVEEDFRDAYVASYDSQDALVDDTIDSWGWHRDLDRLLRDEPLLRSIVTLDRDAIWDFTQEHYDIVNLVDEYHVFEQWP